MTENAKIYACIRGHECPIDEALFYPENEPVPWFRCPTCGLEESDPDYTRRRMMEQARMDA